MASGATEPSLEAAAGIVKDHFTTPDRIGLRLRAKWNRCGIRPVGIQQDHISREIAGDGDMSAIGLNGDAARPAGRQVDAADQVVAMEGREVADQQLWSLAEEFRQAFKIDDRELVDARQGH